MLLGGLWRLLRESPNRQRRSQRPPRMRTRERCPSLRAHRRRMLVGFALLVPVLGFSPTCFLFLAAQLRVLGGWTWWRSLGVAALIALAFHLAFIGFADMPLPKGYFGI